MKSYTPTIFLFISTVFFSISTILPAVSQTLEDYQQQAAKDNPGLQAKYKAFEATMERIPQIRTLPDPTLSIGYFISPVETRVGPQRARFSLTQMFPWFGTLKAGGDVVALTAEAQYQEFLDARNKLYYRVAAAYYPLYELEQWRRLEKENTVILESYKAIATSKFENGEGTLVDVLRVDLMLKEAVTNLKIINEKRIPLQAAFNQLLNRESLEEVEISDSLGITEIGITQDSLYANNPVLTELDLRVLASEKQALLAKKQGLPRLGIGLDYVLVDERTDPAGMSVSDNGKDVLMPMVSISMPLYRKKYRAARKEAQFMRENFALQKADRENQLLSDYEMTAFECDRQKELIGLYDHQIDETQQVLNLLLSAYGNSGKEFEEVLRLQQQLLTYKKMKATSMMYYHISVAKLQYLTAKNY